MKQLPLPFPEFEHAQVRPLCDGFIESIGVKFGVTRSSGLLHHPMEEPATVESRIRLGFRHRYDPIIRPETNDELDFAIADEIASELDEW